MKSADLVRSPTWTSLSTAIGKEFRKGTPFDQIHEMNLAIKQRTLAPYEKHRAALDEFLWFDDSAPKKIIEIGAGYGAMMNVWPDGSRVYNVDLPEMLEVQKHYIDTLYQDKRGSRSHVELVPFTEADRIDFSGAYLFSTWALTETNFETWEYYIERAHLLAGAYLVGWRGWIDIPNQYWPWQEMRDSFKTVRRDLVPYLDYDGEPTDSVELAAVNR